MRRFLTILLSVCILMQMGILGYAEEASSGIDASESTIADEQKYVLNENDRYNLAFMHEIGVLTNIGETDISENREIKRGEFAKMAVGLYGKTYESYQGGNTSYEDIDNNAYYATAVMLLSELGVISGNNNNKFDGESAITFNEAVKILTCIMGYKQIAEMNGGFPGGYNKAASETGLFSGVKVDDNNSDLKVSQLIPLMFNALVAKPVVVVDNDVKNGVTLEKTNDENLLSVYFDIYEHRGIVTGNQYSALLGEKKASKNSVIIDGMEYLDANNKADGYLGYKIKFYYRSDDNGDELVWLKTDSNSSITKISTNDIYTAKTTALSIEYYYGTRTKTLRLKSDVTVLYNGCEYSGFTANTFKNASGDITAISWAGSSVIDVVIVNDYEYYVVDSVDEKNLVIKDKFNKILELDEDDDVIWQREDGTPTSISELKEWDALAYLASEDGEYQVVTLVKNSVEGVVTTYGFDNSSDRDKGTISIDGGEYYISKDYPTDIQNNSYPLENVKTGLTAYIVMDMNNRVILIDMNADSFKLGILQKISWDDNLTDAYVKIFTSQGKHEKFELADKINIDGKVYKTENSDAVKTALKKGDVISYVTDEEKELYPNWQSLLPVDNVYQVVRYIVDDDDLLIKLDTAYAEDSNEPEGLRQMYPTDLSASRGNRFTYKTGTQVFTNVLAKGYSVSFFIPSPLEVGNSDAYAIDNNYYENDKDYTFVPYGVKEESDSSLDAIILIDSYKQQLGESVMISNIYETVNEDNDIVTAVECFNGKKQITLYTEDMSLFKGYRKGDIISYAKNSSNMVTEAAKLYDVEAREETELAKAKFAWANTNVGLRYICASVYKTAGKMAYITNKYNGNGGMEAITDISSITSNDLLEKWNFSAFSVVVYSGTGASAEVKVGSAADIKPYTMYGDSCSRIFARTGYNEPGTVFIFNFDD